MRLLSEYFPENSNKKLGENCWVINAGRKLSDEL